MFTAQSAADLRKELQALRMQKPEDFFVEALTRDKPVNSTNLLDRNLPDFGENNQQTYLDAGSALAKQHTENPRQSSSNALWLTNNDKDPIAFKNFDSKSLFVNLLYSFFELLDIRKTFSNIPQQKDSKNNPLDKIDSALSKLYILGKGVINALIPQELQAKLSSND